MMHARSQRERSWLVERAVTTIRVVVPVRNGTATLTRCLDGLLGQSLRADEVIVVDNGSTDGTAELAAAHPLGAHVIREDRPGSYAARNAGIAAAGLTDVLAFTDADCVPNGQWLSAAAEAIARGNDLVAGRVTPIVSDEPSLWEKFDAGHHVDQRKYVETLGFGATANLVVRGAVFKAVGTFDPSLRSGGDREFCRRATEAGFLLGYAPDAVVGHRSRTSLRETWQLHRRLGAGLHDLSKRGLQPPAWRDNQMLLPIGWAADVANGVAPRSDGQAHRQREMLPLATVVVAARWTGRVTGK
jgi:glycosyltransferase involved in cell wall biosynthesis